MNGLNEVNNKPLKKTRKPINVSWIWDVLIIVVLLIGAWFRFTGLDWDTGYHLHPDERFLTMVETAIRPVEHLSDYFSTSTSTLNPNNLGYTFYVYGTLPIFIVRYVGEWLGQTGYDQIHLVGRAVSGAFDLGTILFIFLIGRKLYKNSKLGLLAALFSAMAVLQIQISHYFTVDNVANFFAYAAIYVAVCIMMAESKPHNPDQESVFIPLWKRLFLSGGHIGKYLVFGALFGLALASKVSIYALAALLPLAAVIYYSKLPKDTRGNESLLIWRNLVLAGILAFIVFRICQPYAFLGPGFFDIKINQAWIASLKELATISSGEVDVPYALQWARRPITFALENLVKWGLGIPLGILGFFGFLWMGWRTIKGDWQKHLLIWGWTAFILITQSMNWVRSMRYLLPLYPAMCLIASWAIFKLWENGAGAVRKITTLHVNWRRLLAVIAAVVTIAGSAGWALAFTNIYTKPVTRVAASEWIYENISGAIRLPIAGEDGKTVHQSLAYQNTATLSMDQPYVYGFIAQADEELTGVTLEHVLFSYSLDQTASYPALISLMVNLREGDESGGDYLGGGFIQSAFSQISDARGEAAVIPMDQTIQLTKGQKYWLEVTILEPNVMLKLDGTVWMTCTDGETHFRQYLPPPAYRLTVDTPYQVSFYPQTTGTISNVELNRAVDLLGRDERNSLRVELINPGQNYAVIATGWINEPFSVSSDPRGEGYTIELDQPVLLHSDSLYILSLTLTSGNGELAIYNDVPAIESTWDDALPLPMYSYNLFGYESGVFGNIRNMELYYDDTVTKKDLLYTTLDQSDAIFISSNRQWGTIVRVPERYPLSTAYYRALVGCPADKDILWCYQVAEPGMFEGQLGFKLTAVFQSDPNIGGLEINDQSAEEAFTVYDHPKVLIFEKTVDYDPAKMRSILDVVDLNTAVHKTPGQASRFDGNLWLGKEEMEIQQSGGTWSELFPVDSLLNTQPWVAALVWYLAIALLGLIAYPIVRTVFHGLPDHGYPFSRLAGLILTAYFVWLAGSTFFTFSRLTIIIVLALLLLASGFLAYRQRYELLEEIKTKKRYFLTAECVMLVLFLVSLGIRYGNPDLWHPYKGGEKPMDLSYFTAVLKSTIFPPYDPWYAGGYINYYYYGFVLVGVPVKLLGIAPAIAYNLILPTLFMFTGAGAFSVGWNLFAHKKAAGEEDEHGRKANYLRSLLAGVASTFTVLIMGNLGTVRMLWQALQRLAAPGGLIDGAKFTERFVWFFQGLGQFFSGARLPLGIGDWYWVPSRALPGETITEFPFFTFTYADLHAHMIALPVTILVIGWGVGILLNRWDWKSNQGIKPWLNAVLTLAFGSLAIGMLKATNTWDFPTYLVLSCLVIFYTILKYAAIPQRLLANKAEWMRKTVYAAGILVFFAAMTLVFFLPFSENYGQAYGSIDPWTTDHSPLSSYLVHWGVQFFIIISWLVWETREWLASTPVSSLQKLRPYAVYLQILAVLYGLVLLLITILGVKIGWLAGLLGAWALILMLRPGQTDGKRLVLFMIGTGLVLTLFVEVFVLVGDIGRMNTVFKFYFQAWTFFGISSAAALIWLIPAVATRWREAVSAVWQVVLAVLVFSAALYPITAATDKIRDRMSASTPETLNGMEFMATSRYFDQTEDLDLSQDYHAILWMQQNVKGSPVIVEANTVEYRWGNRYTIYTGLPGVLGWNWHQRQQRGFIDYNGISNRLVDIPNFYITTDIQAAVSFLKQYNVSYIILGQMERSYYQGPGLDKFEQYDGQYWKEVFRDQDTVIYEVIKD